MSQGPDRIGAALRQLARLHGLQLSYRDPVSGRSRGAPRPAIVALLQALGAPIETERDVPEALHAGRRDLEERVLEPVSIAWEGRPAAIPLGPGAVRNLSRRVTCTIETEQGERRTLQAAVVAPRHRRGHRDTRFPSAFLEIPPLPTGYHRLTAHLGRSRHTTRVISAPRRAFLPPSMTGAGAWGAFLPLYAAASPDGWGAGDFRDLDRLSRFIGDLGGGVVGTLPLSAAFLDDPFSPSPYSPASRLFWNEFYLDVTQLPEYGECAAARAVAESAAVRSALEELRDGRFVDYRRIMSLKRSVLQPMSVLFFSRRSASRDRFDRFVHDHPALELYARFRATLERRRTPWPGWPARLRDGTLRDADYDDDVRLYHLYVQWRCEERLAAISAGAGAALYVDFPLGVHPDGFDVWRDTDAFALRAGVGAPPDPYFTRGQEWGFPPAHPERIRSDGYRHFSDCLRHTLRHAGVLRIDHVMGLHRLFWIPSGYDASHGAYVRYRFEEMYAILSLESHRARALIVGEDLGTVPPAVRPAMRRHGIHSMSILQLDLAEAAADPFASRRRDRLAALNTHDMPPFASFWCGTDLHDRLDLRLFDRDGFRREKTARAVQRRRLLAALRRRKRTPGPKAGPVEVARAAHAALAAGPARLVMVNLEDLWGERKPQNTPGTTTERPNWCRKARYNLPDLMHRSGIRTTLKEIDRCRRGRVSSRSARAGRVPAVRATRRRRSA